MNWPATIANTAWAGTSLVAWKRFRDALKRPGECQRRLLRRLLARHADSAYGREHGFSGIRTYEDFSRRVPEVTYEALQGRVERIRRGEAKVLTTDRVTHLIPTSGSTAGRKLIPFTAGLQRDFNAALGPWMVDLARQHPGILTGPAYWSITPPGTGEYEEPSAVPVGFADDASYLGGLMSGLVRSAMVAPDPTAVFQDMDAFRFETLRCLLAERDLRLISVWHPSFLTLLLDALPGHWDALLDEIGRKLVKRARELERASPDQWQMLWPQLAVISAWGDGPAAAGLEELRHRFPHCAVQAKGLLATEAFVTIPFGGEHPVAVRSHFFEFRDSDGRLRLTDQLEKGETYEVIVSSSGGLWRYLLGDRVRVKGFVDRTPSLEFVGRLGLVSDQRGEKLSEAFVSDVLQRLMDEHGLCPKFALLAPDECPDGLHYTLYLEVDDRLSGGLALALDQALRMNPHYDLCRHLGQLHGVQVHAIRENGYEAYGRRLVEGGQRLGDIKPSALSPLTGWSGIFTREREGFSCRA